VINKSIIKKISDKEMDRKDFLKYSGAILVGVIGLKSIAALIAHVDTPPVAMQTEQTKRGFGSGKYGV
jgi:hypothetical protein